MIIQSKYMLLLIIVLCKFNLSSQTAIIYKLSTTSINFKTFQSDNKPPLQIDNKGILAIEPGLSVSYESLSYRYPASVRINQYFGIDRHGGIALSTQLTGHYNMLQRWKSAINVFAGPTIYLRQIKTQTHPDKSNFEDLTENMEMSTWFLCGGIEYNYTLNRFTDLSISLNHFYRYNTSVMIGIKKWINKKPRRSYKCNTCPSFS